MDRKDWGLLLIVFALSAAMMLSRKAPAAPPCIGPIEALFGNCSR